MRKFFARCNDKVLWLTWQHLNKFVSSEDEGAPVVIHFPSRYNWEPAAKWGDQIRDALALKFPVRLLDIPQTYPRLIEFHVCYRDAKRQSEKLQRCILDYSDYDDVNLPALESRDVYFKMQLPIRQPGLTSPRPVPGRYVGGSSIIHALLPTLRRERIAGITEHEVLGRFGSNINFEERNKVIEQLKGQKAFHFTGGFTKVSYLEHLREAAKAKICLDLPGNGPLCFRLVDYLAIGACVVSVRSREKQIDLGTDLELPVITLSPDDNLIEVCNELLNSPERIVELGKNARAYYDKVLSPAALAEYYGSHFKKQQ